MYEHNVSYDSTPCIMQNSDKLFLKPAYELDSK
jgi:hypothetical protein